MSLSMIFTPIATPDLAALRYPLSCIDRGDDECYGGYSTDDFCEGLLGDDEGRSCGNFPDNIAEYYWIHEGHNDEEPWHCLCKLDNGYYAFYSAWCDYTGFDCQGGMKLIISKNSDKLFNEGLTQSQRDKCLADKAAPAPPKTKEYPTPLARARDAAEFKWDIPVAPKPASTPEKATRAFVRVWENGKELILNLDHVNGLEMEALEYAIRGLTAQFLTPKGDPKPKKKFYNMNLCSSSPSVTEIDAYFKKRFGDPNKKWELRMKFGGDKFIRKWGKIEVSFILY